MTVPKCLSYFRISQSLSSFLFSEIFVFRNPKKKNDIPAMKKLRVIRDVLDND